MCEEHNEQASPAEVELSKPQRLHPTAMFFNLMTVLKETIFGLGIGLIITLKESVFYFLLFVSVFLILLLIYSVISWLRFTYRVEENELRIEQGIFIRKKRYISINRIHKIDVTADIVHRIFKLVKVQIDTASSGGGAEVNLSAVKITKAARLRRALQNEQKTANGEEKVVEYPQRKVSWGNLFIAGSTSGTAGVLLVAILAVFSQIEELIPSNVYKSAYAFFVDFGVLFIVASIILLLIVLWLIGIAGTMIRYGKFTIEKREKELFIKRGLIETKELTIPFDRIQAIGIKQSLIRQPLKYVKITAVVAGGSFDKQEAFPVVFPLMNEANVEAFFAEFLPNYQQIATEVKPLAKRGRKYYLFNASLLFFLALVPVGYFFPSYAWIMLVLIALSLWNGWIRHRDSGYQLNNDRLTFRIRSVFQKETIVMYQRRVQAMEKKQHRIQQYDQIATAKMSLIGSNGLGTHFRLQHLHEADVDQIADWFSMQKNTPYLSDETE